YAFARTGYHRGLDLLRRNGWKGFGPVPWSHEPNRGFLRSVGALARYTGDFALAEDLAQEALAEALVTWPRDGTPRNPAGWLLTVGRRRAIDAFRRNSALDERYTALARDLGEGGALTGAEAGDPARDAEEILWDPDRIDDDVLALMFTACHPVLSQEARVALTLRVIGGLGSDEIARLFLVPTATVQARITRAKKTLAAARVPFEVPPAAERPARLISVLKVIYVIFTEGSTAGSGPELIRFDLAGEAQRLARVLTRLMPDEPEAHGLLALLELTASRFPARTGPDGEPVQGEQQDRRRWRPWPRRPWPAAGGPPTATSSARASTSTSVWRRPPASSPATRTSWSPGCCR
ncbi:DUF3151 family protein, partial [Nocardia farcinica]|uniref:DUF3151 family protein n=1 Tax=Nocardia farcinica TaxID=37329 RepID=UPI003CC7D873